MKHASVLIKVVLFGVLCWVGTGVFVRQAEAGCSGQYKCKPYNEGLKTCNQANESWFVSACTGNTSSVCMDSSSRDDKCCEEVGVWNECAWDGGGSNPTPTTEPPPATCGNGTCGSGESCSNCPADCGECKTYEWANINVLVYGENGLEAPINRDTEPSSGNNKCKGYFGYSSTGRGWSNYNICQNIWLLDMAKTDKSMYISGIDSKYSSCRVELNGTVIDSSFANGTCSVPSRTYKQYDDRLVINLLKSSKPDAAIENVVNLKEGDILPWKVKATDADGNLKSTGIYIHSGTPPLGEENGWKVLKWVGGQNAASVTYSNTDWVSNSEPNGVTPWVCNSTNEGTWTVTTNAVDATGLACTGNPKKDQSRCASGNDRKTFTCLLPPVCTKNNWPTSISATGTGTFRVTGADPDSVSGPTATRVDFVFTKQLTNYCSPGEGNAVDGQWQKLGSTHWNSWNASETLNNATLNLPAGTYMMTANLRDNDNQFSTGNPGTPKGCGWSYNDCNGTFTVLPPPSSCTATLAPNLSLSVGEEDNLSLIVTGAGSISSAVWSKTSNAFGMSSTGTNSRTITGVSAGSGTVNVDVTMLSGARCSASAMVDVHVPSACTVTLNPATLNMAVGESRSVVVGVYNPPFGAPRLRWTMGNMNVAQIASGGLTA